MQTQGSLVSRACAALACAAFGFAFMASADIPASAYVQDGLIAQWDGIDNTGTGTHDSDAVTWVDRVGGRSPTRVNTKGGGGAWGDNCFIEGASASSCFWCEDDDLKSLIQSGELSVELYCSHTSTYTGYEDWLGFGKDGNSRWLKLDIRKSDSTAPVFQGLQYRTTSWNSSAKIANNTICAWGDAPQYGAIVCKKISGKYAATLYGNDTNKIHSVNYGTSAPSDGVFTFGGFGKTGNALLNARIYSVRIYNRALTDEEMEHNALIDRFRFDVADPEGWRWNATTGKIECRVKVVSNAGNPVSLDGETFAAEVEGWYELDTPIIVMCQVAQGRKVFRWDGAPNSAVVGQGQISFAAEACTITPVIGYDIPASAYVQTGLIAQWDGVENAGAGMYDASATVWKDLKGSHDIPLVSGDSFGDDCIKIVKGTRTTETALLDAYAQITIEFNARPTAMDAAGGWNAPIASIPYVGSFGWDGRAGAITVMRPQSATATAYNYRTYDSGYTKLADLMASGVYQTYSAAPGYGDATVGDDSVYVNGEQVSRTSGLNWNSGANTRTQSLLLTVGSAKTASDVRSLRIYNRALSAGEFSYNATIDKIRFEGADPTEVVWPDGYRFNADRQRIEVRIKVKCDEQGGSVSIGESAETWGTGAETAKIVATPAEGWRFVRWEGDVYGLAEAQLKAPELTVTFADQTRTLTAVFNQGDAFSSRDYAQSGLVFQLDGIENAGIGMHDAEATQWIDLVSGARVSLTTNDTVGAKFMKLVASKTIAGFPNVNNFGDGAITVEVCQRASKVLPHNTTGQLSFRAGGRCYLGYRFVYGDVGCVSSFVGSAKDSTFPSPHPYYGVDNGMLRNLAQNEPHTFAAVASIGSSSVWFNGEPRPQTASAVVSSWEAKDSAGVIGNATSQPEYYAVRVYNRALTQEELARHARLDRIRFFGADEGMRPGVVGDEYRVRVTKPDGSVTDTWYAAGETADLSYSPRVGETFRFWKPAPEGVDRTQTSISFTVNEPLSTVARVVDDPSRLTAASYVREGLVLQFDGIANAGVDADGDELHDGKSCWWRDLSGEGQDAYVYDLDSKIKWLDDACDETASGYLKGGYFRFPIGDAFYAAQNNRNASTVQMCGLKHTERPSNTVRAHIVGNENGWGYKMSDEKKAMTYYACGQAYSIEHAKVATNMTLTTTFTTAGAPAGNGFLRRWFGSDTFVESTVSTASMKDIAGREGYIFSTADYDQGFILRAVRFYNRELTDYERLLNTRIDEERFYGTNATRIVSVESDSSDFGEPTGWGYGAYRVEPGEAISCSFTDSLELFDDGIRALPIADGERTGLAGYTVSNRVSASYGNPTASAFAGFADDDFRLIWHWRHQYRLTYTASAGGTVACVKPSGGWHDEGVSVTLTAQPDGDHVFAGWAGTTIGVADLSAATITVPIDRARTLSAVFQGSHHDPVSLSWQGGETGRWSDPANWGGVLPQVGDFVTVGAGVAVTLDTATPALGSLTLQGSVSAEGWNNSINAETVQVEDGGVITCAGGFGSMGEVSNRVWIVCRDLTVDAGGRIDVTGKGWSVGPGVYGAGPGAGTVPCCGGCYGGFAGSGYISLENSGQMMMPYGDQQDPRDPGSAGSASSLGDAGCCGGNGGGAVLVEATGAVALNGQIVADGANGSGGTSGGGSGGGVSIHCVTISGAGSLSARGGSCAATKGGNGSGGRIALHYDRAEQAKLTRPSLSFDVGTPISATGYAYESGTDYGEGGTVWLPDAALIVPEQFNITGQVLVDVAEIALPTLVVDSRRVAFTQEGLRLTVAGDVTLTGTGAATLELGGSLLVHRAYGCSGTADHTGFRRFGRDIPILVTIGGNLTLDGVRSEVVLRAARMTDADADPEDCRPVGGTLKVGGTFSIAQNSRLVTVSHYCTGVSPRIECKDFNLASGATVTAASQGYYSMNALATLPLEGQRSGVGFGPGAAVGYSTGTYAPGGSHIGLGGGGGYMEGKALPDTYLYDSSEMPHMPGSGCARGASAYVTGGGQFSGGGVIFFEVEGRCRLLGTVTANSVVSGNGHYAGCAGGAVCIKARKLYLDPTAVVQAKGSLSAGLGGAGGGGGVAFWRVFDQAGSAITPSMTAEELVALGKVSAAAGVEPDEKHCQTHGTVYLGQLPKPGMLIFVK